MSVQTLYTAATGMESLQTKLDVIANNLANVNTVGFKKDRANFEDLFYRQKVLPGVLDNAGQTTPVGVAIGLGSRVSSVQTDFNQGAFQQTGRQLDVAIAGNGFFQVQDPSGQIMYTRAGNFSVNANGQVVLGSAATGRVLDPPITIPNDATNIVVEPGGRVMVQQANNPQLQQAGQIQLALFINEEGLLKQGENLYSQSDASNTPQQVNPGITGAGLLRQNMLEASNVEPVQELIDLITTQRAFELNSQAVQAGDQILQNISNLRRF
jgi:flagellar basal-body rod protein FlgG